VSSKNSPIPVLTPTRNDVISLLVPVFARASFLTLGIKLNFVIQLIEKKTLMRNVRIFEVFT
jgi:hypothetical protein